MIGVEEREKPRTGLWSHPDFVRLWLGQTVSKLGSHITNAALAATAVIWLKATPEQMGLLGALEGAALLLFGLFAGVWVDRLRRRPVLIVTDLGRALILGLVPLAALLGRLRMELLYIVGALVGILAVFCNVADRAFLPSVVAREDLVEGNSKLGASESTAEIAGPALAGSLVQWLGAPFAVLIDCATYLFSAACLACIRTPEPPPVSPDQRETWGREIAEGVRVVLADPILRALAGSMASLHFFGNFIGTLYWLYLVRELGLSPAIVGLSVGMGGIGALLGAFLAQRVSRRLGLGPSLLWMLGCWTASSPVLPLLHGSKMAVAAGLLAMQLLGDIPLAIYFIGETSLRQAVIPHRLLGRANASLDVLTRGLSPLSALLAGTLGAHLGIRPTLFLQMLGPTMAFLCLYLSPIRRLRTLPVREEKRR